MHTINPQNTLRERNVLSHIVCHTAYAGCVSRNAQDRRLWGCGVPMDDRSDECGCGELALGCGAAGGDGWGIVCMMDGYEDTISDSERSGRNIDEYHVKSLFI
jgi:hypothetical protein